MREFLKSLEINDDGTKLTKEAIDKIMVEYGKGINAEKEKYTALETEKNNLENTIQEKEITINELNSKIDENNKTLENLQNVTNERDALKTQIKMSDSGVKKEFSKFVTSEISSLVNDETDFDTALKNYKNDNPQYFGETIVKKMQTSPELNNGGNQAETTNDIMNSILRSSRN